jgi:cytoskeletal protein CcmA (bactofilin family)
MASTYTANTGIEKIGSGEQAGTWGTTTNVNFDIIDDSLNGVLSLTISGNTTLTTSDGAISNGHHRVLLLGGTPSSAFNLTIDPNNQQKWYLVKNSTGQSCTIKQGGGSGTTVVMATGTAAIIYADGTGANANVGNISTDVLGDTSPQLGGNLDVNGKLIKFGDAGTAGTDDTLEFGADDDMQLYHDATNSYITNKTGALKIATETSGIAVTIGHTTSETTIADNATITGNASVGGTLGVTGVLTGTSLDISGDIDVDGITNLDVVDIDGAVNMASTLLVTGVLTGTSLDISGDIDVDGTTNLDVVDIDGAVNMATTLLVTGETTLQTHLNMGDDDQIKLGASADLKIYHDGSNSYVSDTGTGSLVISGSAVSIVNAAGTENMIFATENGAVTLYYDNGAKIATTSAGVQVTGTITASGDITAFSDRRLKTDIKPITNALPKVMQMQGVYYKRNDIENPPQSIGVIAQDMEAILPEIIHTADDDMQTKSVDYGKLCAILIESIKELKTELNELKKN